MPPEGAQDGVALLTTQDVAKALRVTRPTVRRLIARGELRSIRVGRLLRVEAAALDDYLHRRDRR